MSRARFNVAFEVWTPEAIEAGDTDERGFIEEGATLRDAVKAVRATRTNEVDGVESIECDSCPTSHPRWITVSNSMEYRTGAREQRSLHIPDSVTPATARRIARLVGARVRNPNGLTPVEQRAQDRAYTGQDPKFNAALAAITKQGK